MENTEHNLKQSRMLETINTFYNIIKDRVENGECYVDVIEMNQSIDRINFNDDTSLWANTGTSFFIKINVTNPIYK